MADCGSASKLERNLDRSCDPPVPGVRAKIWVGYLRDLTATPRNTTGKTITAITLKSGAKLFTIEGFKLSNVPTMGFNATDYVNYLPHNFQFAIFDTGETGRIAVDSLVNTDDLFVISREKAAVGNFIVHGINAGMTCTNAGSNSNDATAGAFVLDFSAATETKTPEILKFTTDTETYLDSLTFVNPA